MPPFHPLNPDDVCATFVLTVVLLCIGQVVCTPGTWPRGRGKELGWLAMVTYAGWRLLTSDLSHVELVGIMFRTPMLGGVTVGIAWIVLPAVAWVDQRRRNIIERWRIVEADRTWRREQELKRIADEAARRRAEEEWERNRPAREEAARRAAEAARLEAEQKQLELTRRAAEQRRRNDSRAACEFEYALALPEIEKQFPRGDFAAFVGRYLADQLPPDEVEQRGQQVIAIIRQQQLKTDSQGPRSFADLAKWFEQQRADLSQVGDDATRRLLLIRLKERYDELASQMLENLSP